MVFDPATLTAVGSLLGGGSAVAGLFGLGGSPQPSDPGKTSADLAYLQALQTQNTIPFAEASANLGLQTGALQNYLNLALTAQQLPISLAAQQGSTLTALQGARAGTAANNYLNTLQNAANLGVQGSFLPLLTNAAGTESYLKNVAFNQAGKTQGSYADTYSKLASTMGAAGLGAANLRTGMVQSVADANKAMALMNADVQADAAKKRTSFDLAEAGKRSDRGAAMSSLGSFA